MNSALEKNSVILNITNIELKTKVTPFCDQVLVDNSAEL